jgi:hypothetical protein
MLCYCQDSTKTSFKFLREKKIEKGDEFSFCKLSVFSKGEKTNKMAISET